MPVRRCRTEGPFPIVSDNADLTASNPFGMAAGKYTVISVRDRGCGIPPENLHRIFFQLDFSTKSTGMESASLPVRPSSRPMVGAIRVASQVGVGSEFLVFLPSTDVVS